MQHRIRALVIHRLKRIADRRGLRSPAAHRKIRQIVHRNRRQLALQRPRNLRPQRHRTKCRRLPRQCLLLQRPVQPSIRSRLHPRRSTLHIILRVEVRPRRIRRARCMNNREMPLVIQRLESRHRGMQSKESIQIQNILLPESQSKAASHSSSSLCTAPRRSTHPPRPAETAPPASSCSPQPSSPRPERFATETPESSTCPPAPALRPS